MYQKPQLGAKPDWVSKAITVSPKTIISYSTLKKNQPEKRKAKELVSYLEEISKEINTYLESPDNSGNTDIISLYDELNPLRLRFLELLSCSDYVENNAKYIATFFENLANRLPLYGNVRLDFVKIRIHEWFVYTIAHYIINKDYSSAEYILGKTYFSNYQIQSSDGVSSYQLFHCSSTVHSLDKAICARDNQEYYTGTGHHWIESVCADYCSREQFILADLICYNYSVYGKCYNDDWPWFPITYVYDNGYHSCLNEMGKKLISAEYTQELLSLFGYNSIDELKKKMTAVEQNKPSHSNAFRYSGTPERPKLLGDYIKASEIGKYR